MIETAVSLPQCVNAESFRDLVALRGRLEQATLTFEDGTHLYVRLCRSTQSGISPDEALENGDIEECDCGDIVLISSSKFPGLRLQLALSIVALVGGRILECG